MIAGGGSFASKSFPMRPAFLLAPVSAVLFSVSLHAQPGALNTSFGVDGKVLIAAGSTDEGDNPRAVVVQPDGRIVVVGYVFPMSQLSWGYVARLMPNGALDASFGSGGIVSWIPSTGTLQINAVAMQPDGKILLGGAKGTAAVTTTQDAWFGRLNTDGTIDAGFGVGGERVLALSTSTDYVIGVGVAADGAIYGHIHSGPPSNAPACMARLTPEGQTDASFNGNGVRCNLYGGNSGNSIGGIAVRTDGAALGAGSVSSGKVAAVLANGQFDSGFGTSGLATSPAGTNAWRTSGIGIRPDGRILVTTWKPTSPFSIQLAQLMPNGSPDPSFGTDGLALFTPQGMNISTWMSNAVIYPDGRIIISWGRFNSAASELDHAVSWFNADGSPHAIGTVITDMGPNSSDQDNARGLAMAPGGDIIALGSYVDASGGTAVLRFNGDLNTTSVEEVMDASALRVFPNPANEVLRVEWPGEPRIEKVVVRDAAGRVVPAGAHLATNAAGIDLTGMTSGVYFVEVMARGQVLRRLFVVER